MANRGFHINPDLFKIELDNVFSQSELDNSISFLKNKGKLDYYDQDYNRDRLVKYKLEDQRERVLNRVLGVILIGLFIILWFYT